MPRRSAGAALAADALGHQAQLISANDLTLASASGITVMT
jgi:hypothetical protein